jgi:hypothetical protein
LIYCPPVEHNDGPLPRVDVAATFHSIIPPFNPDADSLTISVEVMSVQGTMATVITHDPHIFYDAEVLAVVHRFKSKSKGLVGTQVWAWRGSKCHVGEREEKKLQELARRYNTVLVRLTIDQYHNLMGAYGRNRSLRMSTQSPRNWCMYSAADLLLDRYSC